ncbi:SiaB family protein kinase [Carboxylicivirga mesophila]|uniref:SiaB family protein kinase n=1 Tax=Carboxylicivirga mesophila TaxID=1166478 RepID=A0ABS5KDM0_9BACT|nr:SiaB family protein kinase [Carboxylicivirga mesophila]MBS2213071.1 SiaB family protein kinase [Carboxylicivirga mesophila]
MDKNKENHGFLDFAYQMYKTMKTNEINLVYEGEVTQEITKTFTSLTERSLEKSQESNTVQRKVFNVMVECLQNISKHADSLDDDEDERRGIVMVSHGESSYNIITGNVIKNEKVPELKANLELVNSLDKKGLSELYKKQMKEGRISDKGGAGLGFIDIAKKTGSKLSYEFKKLNEDVSFFILTSTVQRN